MAESDIIILLDKIFIFSFVECIKILWKNIYDSFLRINYDELRPDDDDCKPDSDDNLTQPRSTDDFLKQNCKTYDGSFITCISKK